MTDARVVAPFVPNVASAWYPIQPGDTWVYQKESDDGGNTGGMAHPLLERWTTENTVAVWQPLLREHSSPSERR